MHQFANYNSLILKVWNQSRPPWLNALIKPLKIMMQPVVEVLLEAAKVIAIHRMRCARRAYLKVCFFTKLFLI